MTTEISENLTFVTTKLIEIVKNLNDKQAITPTRENAIELIILHDIKDLITPCQKDGAFDLKQMERILIDEYIKSIKLGNTGTFYNYRQVLSNEVFVKHLKALLV